jgi:hypothetical protein
MVGCGTSAEDKKMITDQGTKIAGLEKQLSDMTKTAMDMSKKLGDVETFLKDPKSKFGSGAYGTPDTTKKAAVAPKPPTAPKAPVAPTPKPKAPPTKTK